MTRSDSSKHLIATLSLLAFLYACDSGARDGMDSAAGATDTATTAAAATDTGPHAPSAPGEMLDPNTATREQLMAVPGMAGHIADAIVASRPYATMLDVDRALAGHTTEAQRDSVYARVWKPIDLNRASSEEILLIPGVGDRMKHEFEEYRPYRSMAQFRREIGKYVREDELNRLQKYVTLDTTSRS